MEGKIFDTIIVGASFAGRSAALTLCRVRRSVLMIDSGAPRNKDVHHFHNFIGMDGEDPQHLWNQSDKELRAYPTFSALDDCVANIRKDNTGIFEIITSNNRHIKSNSVLLSSGVTDFLPDIPGLKACWGISAWHCPFCHGYEFRDEAIAICPKDEEEALHMANIIARLTGIAIIFNENANDWPGETKKIIENYGFEIVPGQPAILHHSGGHLSEIETSTGKNYHVSAFYLLPELRVALPFAAELALNYDEHKLIERNPGGLTNVEGVYVAGDICEPIHQAVVAAASGVQTAIAINGALMQREMMK